MSELELPRPRVIQGMHVRFDVTAADRAALADFQLAHSAALRRTMRGTYWMAAGTVIALAGSIALFTRSMFFAGVATTLSTGDYELPVILDLDAPSSVCVRVTAQSGSSAAVASTPATRSVAGGPMDRVRIDLQLPN